MQNALSTFVSSRSKTVFTAVREVYGFSLRADVDLFRG